MQVWFFTTLSLWHAASPISAYLYQQAIGCDDQMNLEKQYAIVFTE